MAMTVAIMGHRTLNALVERLNYTPPPGINIRIFDGIMEEALQIARSLEMNNEADVFVTAGGNYDLLSQHLQTPLVEIKVTGFDFLLALEQARKVAREVALITYRKRLPYLDKVLNTLTVPVKQVTWNNIAQMDTVIESLLAEGISTFIGGSLVCGKAESGGMKSFFLYSEDGVIRALDGAVKIALAKKQEMAKAEELQAILNFAYEGVIATDGDGMITVFNPTAEKITGISRFNALGRFADDVLPNTRLTYVMKSRQSEISQIQAVGDVKILTNRIPIFAQGEVVGSVATFKDIGMIQEAEEKIREKLYQKGFVAKNTFADILGQSPAITEAKNEAILYAKRESTVLILGESGTGKELFAQAMHNASRRAKRPFVAINCAALPPSLLESELFGYEEGAFTGAKKGGRPGLFELAHGGTIFLDEIGEMPMPIQSRLLRVLEEHEVLRVGGEKIVHVDIRVIAATNKNLWDMVKRGGFREDLYYRLCVLELRLPSLYERKDDIPVLIGKFLSEFRRDMPGTLTKKIARHPLLGAYRWPGNVRELRNIVERFSVLHHENTSVDALIAMLLGGRSAKRNTNREKEELLAVLEEVAGNKSEAAKKMGVSRTTLWRKLREFHIK